MRRFAIVSLALLSACSKPAGDASANNVSAAAPSPTVDTAPAETVARDYLADLTHGRFAAARARWDRDGAASGGSAEDLARAYRPYQSLQLTVGKAESVSTGADAVRTTVPVMGTATVRGQKRDMTGVIYLQRPTDPKGKADWRIWAADIRLKH